MNGTDLHALINSVLAGISLIGVIYAVAVKMTRLEVKVDVIWGTLLKRALVDGVANKLMEVNSPIRLVNNSGELLAHMAPELQAFYRDKCKGLDEKAAAAEIEKVFGDRLIKEVCIPNNISNLVCILIALAVAKNTGSLTEILDANLRQDELPAEPSTAPEEAID